MVSTVSFVVHKVAYHFFLSSQFSDVVENESSPREESQAPVRACAYAFYMRIVGTAAVPLGVKALRIGILPRVDYCETTRVVQNSINRDQQCRTAKPEARKL